MNLDDDNDFNLPEWDNFSNEEKDEIESKEKQKRLYIRKAKLDDLNSIDDIYNQAILIQSTCDVLPLTAHVRLVWFNKHIPETYPVFVAEINHRIVGWLSFSPYREGRDALQFTAEISYYIHRDFQRQGIGTHLLKFSIQKAPEYNFKNLFAILLENNTGSKILLEKSGFSKWAYLPKVAIFNGKKIGQFYYGLNL